MKPLLVIVGGPDVDARIELMHYLDRDFICAAAGTNPVLRERFKQAGFRYFYYHMPRETHPFHDLRAFAKLLTLFRAIEPDIVHTYDTKPGVFGRWAARLAKVPVVIGTLPGLGSLYVEKRLLIQLQRALYEPMQKIACHISDLTIFQNGADCRQFVAKGIAPAGRATVIPGSGIRTDLFDPKQTTILDRRLIRTELGLPEGSLVVTMISRLIRSKGVREFVEAARIVHQTNQQVAFLLVGAEDHASVDRLNLEEKAKLKFSLNWVGERKDVRTILAATDIFVLPSYYREGIPRVLLEAAAMSLPIITTDWPGCCEVVENESNGLLVPIQDVESLYRAILYLVERPELRRQFGVLSRQKAVNQYSLPIIAEKTRSIYLRLLTHKGVRKDVMQGLKGTTNSAGSPKP